MTDELLTPDELAAYLKVAVKTLAQWRWQRVGPPHLKAGGHVRYRRSAVEAWLEASEPPPVTTRTRWTAPELLAEDFGNVDDPRGAVRIYDHLPRIQG